MLIFETTMDNIIIEKTQKVTSLTRVGMLCGFWAQIFYANDPASAELLLASILVKIDPIKVSWFYGPQSLSMAYDK